MSDRWNHHTVVVDTPHPLRIFVPGEHPAEAREHVAGFKVRVRGAGGTVVHAYRCPAHGLFDVRVERANVPDEMACPHLLSGMEATTRMEATVEYGCFAQRGSRCGLTSPWAGSFCGQGKASGECAT